MTDASTTRAPWFKFFPADWQGDELLSLCSLAARGLLIELLCLMHRAAPYGYLLVHGVVPSDMELARLCRATTADIKRARKELLDRGVLSTTADGTVYSRRMVRLAEQAAVNSANGTNGAGRKWGHRSRDQEHSAARTRSQRLTEARAKGTHTQDEWAAMRAVYQRCLRCGRRESDLVGASCVKDHIVPLYQGGDDSIQNLQPLCRECNSSKGSDRKDYRIGLPETPQQWLVARRQTPSEMPNGNAYETSGPIASGTRILGSDLRKGALEIQPADDPEFAERAGRFLERYQQIHQEKRRGARYVGKVHIDFAEALQLVAVFDDERLDKLATVWLTTNHDFAESGTRSIPKFRSMISWCDERLREHGL